MNSKLTALLSLASLLTEGDPPSAMTSATAVSNPEPAGQHLVVLDRGFVYVGLVTRSGDYLRIQDAKNIRKWGTSKGLGELRNGPLSDTVLDEVGEVLVPFKALIHLIPCKGF